MSRNIKCKQEQNGCKTILICWDADTGQPLKVTELTPINKDGNDYDYQLDN